MVFDAGSQSFRVGFAGEEYPKARNISRIDKFIPSNILLLYFFREIFHHTLPFKKHFLMILLRNKRLWKKYAVSIFNSFSMKSLFLG